MAVESTQTKRASQKGTTNKPGKPYPAFPLTPHNSGAWQKKIRGQIYYFGRWGRVKDGKLTRIDGDGWKEALAEYKAKADDLHAGRKPRPQSDGSTIADLCNRFLTVKSHQLDSHEITARTFADYRSTTDRIVKAFGKTRRIDDLGPEDFESLRASIAKTWGPVRLGNEVQRTRCVFKYGYDAGLIEKPVRFGSQFRKPSKSVMRKHRVKAGSRMFSAAEVRLLLGTASIQLKAMILLGINCGFGNHDCGTVTKALVDLKHGWVTFPRPKTGIERRCSLWPETIEALELAIADRPLPKSSDDEDIVFITKYGHRWIRNSLREVPGDRPKSIPINSVGSEFGKLLRSHALNRSGLGFYSLRHSFRTVADATRDFPAVRLIMGHADGSIDDVYREFIDDARLIAVTEHVRNWLFASPRPMNAEVPQ